MRLQRTLQRRKQTPGIHHIPPFFTDIPSNRWHILYVLSPFNSQNVYSTQNGNSRTTLKCTDSRVCECISGRSLCKTEEVITSLDFSYWKWREAVRLHSTSNLIRNINLNSKFRICKYTKRTRTMTGDSLVVRTQPFQLIGWHFSHQEEHPSSCDWKWKGNLWLLFVSFCLPNHSSYEYDRPKSCFNFFVT